MNEKEYLFIDLFSGCGGISLGLNNAGWKGIFAVEKSDLAFETLKYNLIDGKNKCYNWPEWLPKTHHDIRDFRKKYRKHLKQLSGNVDLIAGGPPCQGFSFAGRRKGNDERNEFFKKYIGMVKSIKPKIILLENVEGITIEIGKTKNKPGRKSLPYSEKIENHLKILGYQVFKRLIDFSEYGVPQSRKRFIMLGFRIEIFGNALENPFERLLDNKLSFLREKGLPVSKKITIKQAISDLESEKFGKVACPDSKGFLSGLKGQAESSYQKLMRKGSRGIRVPDSHRLVNHTPKIVDRFKLILSSCRRGVQISSEERKKYNTKKHCIVPADESKPSPTLTTLPDDLLHYSEPRVLTVREYARIQSFPDWYEFKGKYTTGSSQRKKECPRYTQIGNAVPPLFSEVIGKIFIEYLEKIVDLNQEESCLTTFL